MELGSSYSAVAQGGGTPSVDQIETAAGRLQRNTPEEPEATLRRWRRSRGAGEPSLWKGWSSSLERDDAARGVDILPTFV